MPDPPTLSNGRDGPQASQFFLAWDEWEKSVERLYWMDRLANGRDTLAAKNVRKPGVVLCCERSAGSSSEQVPPPRCKLILPVGRFSF